jgi:hypothetical protein
VCVGDPLPLSVPTAPRTATDDSGGGFTAQQARYLAEHLAGQLRAAAPEPQWHTVLRRVEQLLDIENPT